MQHARNVGIQFFDGSTTELIQMGQYYYRSGVLNLLAGNFTVMNTLK